ncbi:MAG: YdcF family protein [Opitutaceae bacterium]|nr:YdcF family protein [Opitutaceae bacterium]
MPSQSPRYRSRLWKNFKHIAVGGMAAGAAFVLACAVIAGAGLRDRDGCADVALVLGSKVAPDGTPSARLQARLAKTLELYRLGKFPFIVVSGGTGIEGFDEAVVMRDWLVAQGVLSESVIMDGAGATTFASAQNLARIARGRGFRSVFVVSQYFHLPRARLALRRSGFGEVCAAHAEFFEARDLYSIAREAPACLLYWFRQYERK